MSTEIQLHNGNGAQIAPRGPAQPAIVTDEHRRILREMIDRNATPAQVDMLILVGNRYGLDPIMGHVVLINGKAFVTHKGLMHKAHDSRVFDGIETSYGKDDLGEWCECRVWRSDMTRPFAGRIYINEYRGSGPVWGKYPRAMAAKTAESFVLRRAFDVSLTSQEEMGVADGPDAAPVRHSLPPPVNEFPSQRREQSGPSPQATGNPACEECGKALTAAQKQLSVRNYGEALCPACQKKPRQAPAPMAEERSAVNGEPAGGDDLWDDETEALLSVEPDAGPGHGE